MSLFHKKTESSGFFIPTKDGFKELNTDGMGSQSFNDIAIHLGYHPDQVYTYFGDFERDFEIQQMCFEVFTANIVFIYTKKSVTRIEVKTLIHFIRNFKIFDEFDSLSTKNILESGIINKSLTIKFLTKVLEFDTTIDDGGIVFCDRLGLYLYFSNGCLVDFNSADGLNEWAKYLRNINFALFNAYVDVANKYWGAQSTMIQDEVNLQGQSLAATPQAFKNEFLEKHRAEFNTVNFFMLLACHYDHKIDDKIFRKINHGRFMTLDCEFGTMYRYNDFIFHFHFSGELKEIRSVM